MVVAVRIDECKGGDHPGDTPSGDVWNPLAFKDMAVAETIGVCGAATLLYERDPCRARSTLQRAEKPPTAGTTTLLPMSLQMNSTRCCTCWRAVAVLPARHVGRDHGCHHLEPATATTDAGKIRSGVAMAGQRGRPWLHDALTGVKRLQGCLM